MAEDSGWMVTGIIFIILFFLMVGVSVYMFILRRNTMKEVQEAHMRYVMNWEQNQQRKTPWYGGEESHI